MVHGCVPAFDCEMIMCAIPEYVMVCNFPKALVIHGFLLTLFDKMDLIRLMSTSKDFHIIIDHKVSSVDILSFGFGNEFIWFSDQLAVFFHKYTKRYSSNYKTHLKCIHLRLKIISECFNIDIYKEGTISGPLRFWRTWKSDIFEASKIHRCAPKSSLTTIIGLIWQTLDWKQEKKLMQFFSVSCSKVECTKNFVSFFGLKLFNWNCSNETRDIAPHMPKLMVNCETVF